MNKARSRAAAWGLAAWAVLTQSALGADTGRKQLDAFLHELTTLSAEFEQRVFDEEGAALESSAGRLELARPGRFAWTYTTPYRQSIVSDGRTLWLYDEELAQVTVNQVDTSAAGSAAQLLGERVDLDAEYTVRELGNRDGAVWIRLLPKHGERQYTAVEIGLTDGVLSTMRLTDNLGQTTELRFTGVRRNPPLDPRSFSFTPPPGVDVVTGTGSAPD
ncbi:MAG: outer membrane lipoprotein chaperone LolA [Gammaproteobacteria bacterium]